MGPEMGGAGVSWVPDEHVRTRRVLFVTEASPV